MIMKNLLFNNIWKNKIFQKNDYLIYFKNLNKIDNCYKVLFYEDVNDENLNKIAKYYDEIIEAPCIDKNRYSELDFLLTNQNKFNYILFCDVRDVIIQNNPFNYMEDNKKDLYLVSEGMKVIDSIPNHNWMHDLTKTMKSNNKLYFMDSVINGGIFGGKQKDIIYLLINMLSFMDRNSSNPIYDQTALSFLNHFLKNVNDIEICKPNESNFCLTGEGVGKHNVSTIIDDNLHYLDIYQKPYYLVHQWDRTSLADKIREKYLQV